MSQGVTTREFPLSPLQEGMLFNQMMSPGSGVDIVQMVVTLHEPVDADRLKACWARVVERHEMLRVRFHINPEGGNTQSIDDACPLLFEVLDWSGMASEAQESEWARLTRALRVTGFDFARAPLSRVHLVRLGDHETRLAWTFFHAIADGRAVTIVLEDVFSLYDGLVEELSPARASFREFVEWLGTHEEPGAEAFWASQYEGLEQSNDGVLLNPPVPGPARLLEDQERLRLDAGVTARMRALSEEAGATMNSIMLGAWGLLLARCARERDVVLGAVKTCRRSSIPGGEDIVGPMVNTLPLRLRVDPAKTTRQWLGDIRQAWLDLRSFEHSPLPRVQEASGLGKDTPLFETAFGFEGYNYISYFRQRWPDLWNKRRIRRTIQTSFPMALIANDGEQLLFRLDYDPLRLSKDDARRVLDHLAAVLDQMTAAPDAPLGDLSILSEEETALVLSGFNRTERELVDDRPVPVQIAERQGAEPAMVDEGQTVSYADLNTSSDRIAAGLSRLGVGKGDAVGVCVPRHAGMACAFLGVMRSGAAYAPIDPAHPEVRIASMIAILGSGTLLTTRRLGERLNGVAARIIYIEDLLETRGAAGVAVEPLPEDLAYVIFTSGSTGEPKGVEITHASLTNLVSWHRREYALKPGDRCTQVAGVGFDACAWELWPALCAGSSVRVFGPDVSADAPALASALDAHAIDVAFVPTPIAEQMLRSGVTPRTLRAMLTGGDRLTVGPSSPLPFRLVNHYGPTENTVVATAGDVGAGGGMPPHIGTAIDNVRVYVLDPDLHPMPIGVAGELCIAGAQVARGYRNRAALTSERFIDCPFEPGARMYRTGDLVRRRADGMIEFVGRVDEQIKVRGYRIEPGEIESALMRTGLVERAIVLRDDAGDESALRAFVVASGDSTGPLDAGDTVEDWKSLYDATYAGSAHAADDAAFNIVGWNSSYTGRPIPEPEMRQWVDAGVERILRHRPGRVLEIGCGTGLMLSRVAPSCERYVGVDFSSAAIEAARAAIAAHPELAHAELHQRRADELDGLGDDFDTVVLNSIVQYFPDMEYLAGVIAKAASLVRDGGRIIVGDVRSLPLLEAYHASILLHRGDDALSPAQFRERVARGVAREEELAIDPAAFGAMVGRVPRVRAAHVALKRGAAHNELTRFRYEVVLEIGGGPAPAPRPGGASPGREGVPNARLDRERVALRWMRGLHEEAATLGELRSLLESMPPGVDPESVWAGDAGGAPVDVTYDGGDPTRMRIVSGTAPAAPVPDDPSRAWNTFANDPRAGSALRGLPERLRAALAESLPGYMTPATITVVQTIPLTRNGKIDRRALLRLAEAGVGSRAHTPPATETEVSIAEAWRDLLRVERVGATDNFFELGGHSLLATRLCSMLRGALGVDVPLRVIFECPTVRTLAEHVDAMRFASGAGDDRPVSGREVFEL